MSKPPLGQASEYPRRYTPDILYPVARSETRDGLGIGPQLPFSGVDVWNAYELSWLDATGKPAVGIAALTVPASSPNIIESKSLKLYLGSLALSRYRSAEQLATVIAGDLSHAAGTDVGVRITPAALTSRAAIGTLPGRCIDGEDIAADWSEVMPGSLQSGQDVVDEELHSHLLRSLCPVTNQPDSASVLIRYHGPRIDRAGLLAYIVSFREHIDFHEACVERIFMDIKARCRPQQLTVYARYNRRGGIDINPFRSDFEQQADNIRLWRQ